MKSNDDCHVTVQVSVYFIEQTVTCLQFFKKVQMRWQIYNSNMISFIFDHSYWIKKLWQHLNDDSKQLTARMSNVHKSSLPFVLGMHILLMLCICALKFKFSVVVLAWKAYMPGLVIKMLISIWSLYGKEEISLFEMCKLNVVLFIYV